MFIATMQRTISVSGRAENDNAIVEMALKLSSIHRQTNQDEKAEQGYLFCIQTQRDKMTKDEEEETRTEADDQDTLALYGMSRDGYGQFLMSKGRVKAALVQFEEALKTSLQLNGELSETTLNIQNSIATCLSMVGKSQ